MKIISLRDSYVACPKTGSTGNEPPEALHFGVMKSFLLIVIVFNSISEIIPGLFQIINQPGYDGRSWSGSAFRSLKHSPGQLGSLLDCPL